MKMTKKNIAIQEFNKSANTNWIQWLTLGLMVGLIAGGTLGISLEHTNSKENLDYMSGIYKARLNSVENQDVYACEQDCKDWFYVFNAKDTLSCGGMWVTDCFKHCYEELED